MNSSRTNISVLLYSLWKLYSLACITRSEKLCFRHNPRHLISAQCSASLETCLYLLLESLLRCRAWFHLFLCFLGLPSADKIVVIIKPPEKSSPKYCYCNWYIDGFSSHLSCLIGISLLLFSFFLFFKFLFGASWFDLPYVRIYIWWCYRRAKHLVSCMDVVANRACFWATVWKSWCVRNSLKVSKERRFSEIQYAKLPEC